MEATAENESTTTSPLYLDLKNCHSNSFIASLGPHNNIIQSELKSAPIAGLDALDTEPTCEQMLQFHDPGVDFNQSLVDCTLDTIKTAIKCSYLTPQIRR